MKNGARPRSRRTKTHDVYSSRINEQNADRLHEDIAEFEEYRQTILKKVRKDIQAGMSAKDILKKYAPAVQGRLLTTALTTADEKVLTALGKDIMDRSDGKATEKKEVTHKFEDLKDEELDAILKSEEEDLEDMENRFEQ